MMGGNETIIAREVTTEGVTLTLRDKNGKPEWNGMNARHADLVSAVQLVFWQSAAVQQYAVLPQIGLNITRASRPGQGSNLPDSGFFDVAVSGPQPPDKGQVPAFTNLCSIRSTPLGGPVGHRPCQQLGKNAAVQRRPSGVQWFLTTGKGAIPCGRNHEDSRSLPLYWRSRGAIPSRSRAHRNHAAARTSSVANPSAQPAPTKNSKAKSISRSTPPIPTTRSSPTSIKPRATPKAKWNSQPTCSS